MTPERLAEIKKETLGGHGWSEGIRYQHVPELIAEVEAQEAHIKELEQALKNVIESPFCTEPQYDSDSGGNTNACGNPIAAIAKVSVLGPVPLYSEWFGVCAECVKSHRPEFVMRLSDLEDERWTSIGIRWLASQ